jgi:hypothetical protein
MKEDDPFGYDPSEAARASGLFDARMQGLRNLARKVFLDRNVQGMLLKDRPALKDKVRPLLRKVIRHVRRSRTALLDGDIRGYERERDAARDCFKSAGLILLACGSNYWGEHLEQLRDYSARGGEKTAETYTKPELEAEVGAFLAEDKGRPIPRGLIKAWASKHDVSRHVVTRAIDRVRRGKIRSQ